ncbi:alpha/beta fold hydrolase [Actinoplanes palleronii]|uniref:Epoxide hydrolase n=1 Tax=Actinoplanes palleronii TaxID=113570 RepID=A0ABQ4BFN8_9ACTN|nr:alpha/beta hydrolase [Actinoplanes palleronii]GIE69464.1 epoxide hydrolase [Actinoplanes palleronii]
MIEHRITTGRGHVFAEEYPGDGPAIVMTHGYPDDSRIYRKLRPELAGRHLVTFDFQGYGRSARIVDGSRENDLAAVIEQLGLDRPVLVGHDSGGPVVINHALDNPGQVSRLVLLNTYFGASPTLRFPEFIRLLADPALTGLADAVLADPKILGWMLTFTDGHLNPGPPDPAGVGATAILPQFYGEAGRQSAAIAAIRGWTAELFTDVAAQEIRIAAGEPAKLDVPVDVVFGAGDPYFDDGVAGHLWSLFTGARRHKVEGAAHWPQWDRPGAVAAVLKDRS